MSVGSHGAGRRVMHTGLKSNDCSYRGPGFHSQHKHGCSQLSVTQLQTSTHICIPLGKCTPPHTHTHTKRNQESIRLSVSETFLHWEGHRHCQHRFEHRSQEVLGCLTGISAQRWNLGHVLRALLAPQDEAGSQPIQMSKEAAYEQAGG